MSVPEIVLNRFIGSRPDARVRADEMLPAAAVVAELQAAAARGESVVLLRLDECPGGQCAESFALYDALRAYSAGGGVVVAHVTGWASSTAAALVAAADYVVMDRGAAIIVHAMYGGATQDVAQANAVMLGILSARTGTPEADLRHWLTLRDGTPGPNFAELDPDAALSHGWADTIGPLERARALAERLARWPEDRPLTPRRLVLATRDEPRLPPRVDARVCGVKLDHLGTALKAAKENVQIGSYTIEETLAMTAAANFPRVYKFPTNNVAVVHNGSGYVALCTSNGAAYYSGDYGVTWTAYTCPALVYRDICYMSNVARYVAVGDSGSAYGGGQSNWTSLALTGSYYAIAFSPTLGMAVAVQASGAATTAYSYTTTGTSWTAGTMNIAAFWGGVRWVGGTVNRFIATGRTAAGNPVCYSSTNGTTWSNESLPNGGTTFLSGLNYPTVVVNCDYSKIGIICQGYTWLRQTNGTWLYYTNDLTGIPKQGSGSPLVFVVTQSGTTKNWLSTDLRTFREFSAADVGMGSNLDYALFESKAYSQISRFIAVGGSGFGAGMEYQILVTRRGERHVDLSLR
ncbi:MAG: ATP-dependent Clp protease proteolytic subunit [Anaeromyxobacter sp.]